MLLNGTFDKNIERGWCEEVALFFGLVLNMAFIGKMVGDVVGTTNRVVGGVVDGVAGAIVPPRRKSTRMSSELNNRVNMSSESNTETTVNVDNRAHLKLAETVASVVVSDVLYM